MPISLKTRPCWADNCFENMKVILIFLTLMAFLTGCNESASVKSGAKSHDTAVGTPTQKTPSFFSILQYSLSDSTAQIQWSASDNADYYEIKYRIGDTGQFTSIATTGTSYTLTGLSNGQTYTVYIVALNAIGSNSSDAITLNPQTGINIAPVAENIFSSLAEDTERTIALKYSDANGDLATSCIVSNLVNVAITEACACNSGVCNVTIKSLPDFHGTGSFKYTIANDLTSNQANADITVIPVDDPPVAYNVNPTNITIGEEEEILLPYSDTEGDKASQCFISNFVNGSVTTPCSCAAGICSVGVTSYQYLTGIAYFDYEVRTGTSISNIGKVTVSLAPRPILSYIGSLGTNIKLGKSFNVAPILFSASGGIITNCTISPALPAGLSIHPTSCEITGTPSSTMSAQTYLVTAIGSLGNSLPADLTLSVSPSAPILSYSGSTGTTGAVDELMTVAPTILNSNGTSITGCTISPALPSWASINPGNCTITGTPTAPLALTIYKITAHNGAGSSDPANVVLSVNASKPTISYASSTGKTISLGQNLTVIPSTLKDNGSSITNCTSSPALPIWASLNQTTCVITGTPTTILPATNYTITATNGVGTTSATLTLTVNPSAPSLSYQYSVGGSGTFGVPMTVIPSSISANGTPILSCTVSPVLPSWASLHPTNCRITGTPDEILVPSRIYTVTATNAAGTSQPATVVLRVDPSVPTLSYTGATGTNATFGNPMTVTPTLIQNKGSSIFQCQVTPALPSWATINPSTCVISGTPNSVLPTTSYSVVARNSVGYSLPATVVLRVNPAIPVISYSGSSGTAGIFNEAMSVAPSLFKNGGMDLNSCTSSPALPAWATLNSKTCVITGTPNQALSPSIFTIYASNSSGSGSATVTLSVDPKVPTLSYGSTIKTGYTGNTLTITPTTLNANGAVITGCSSSPALPAWLNLNTTTCVITGTPTAVMTPSTYVITAENNKGSSSGALLTIDVKALAEPTLSYLGATGTNGAFGSLMQVAPTTLNPNGRDVTACTISPALPSGLTINQTNCVISGVPTSILAPTTFTVSAKNSIGIGTSTVTLSVSAAVPTISYASSAGKIGTYGIPMSITPSIYSANGATITNCYSESALPAGLVIDPGTCVIYGTPTVTITSTAFSIKAVNSVGTSPAASVNITINAAAPTLSYSGVNGTVGLGTAFNVVPTSILPNGSAITSCTAFPALPAGVTINNTTCVISGVASNILTPTAFTITVANAAGSTSAIVTLTVNPIAPVLSYSGATGTNGAINNPMTVTPTTFKVNGGPSALCTISPALPATLALNSSTCVITGTPTDLLPLTTYTVTLSTGINPDAVAAVSLAVTNTAVPSVSYTSATGSVNDLMIVNPASISSNGYPITDCTITPALPAELSIDELTCVISGTPSAVMAATTFHVVATNNVGSSTPAPIILSINAKAPTLSYNDTTGKQGVALTINPAVLNLNGSPVTSCLVTPALPAGLSLNNSTCVISGTPATLIPETNFTISASNSAGTTAATLKLTLVAGPPEISYSGAVGTVINFGSLMNVAPTIFKANGGTINNCTISPALPGGLSLDPLTCVISGTSSIAFTSTVYTVTVHNLAGESTSANVTLRINPNIPNLSYVGSLGTNGSLGGSITVSPTTLDNQGAAITNCSATPALPIWATLNPNTCVITGVPTNSLPATTYSIRATNSAGNSLPASLTLTVDPDAPTVSYLGSTGMNGVFGINMEVVPSVFNGNGFTVNQCVTTPALPSGLTIASNTCVISGTPTQVKPAIIYNVRATNTAGNFSETSVTLSVSANVPLLSYSFSDTHGETLGTPMVVTPSTLQERGAAITCSITPPLPAGFTLNPLTCAISGTPTLAFNSAHTVTATNSSGSTPASIIISAGAQPPVISYDASAGRIINYDGSFNVKPSTLLTFDELLTGCVFSADSPARPAWLTLSSSCTISGSPSGPLPSTTYKVIAKNSQGDSIPAAVTLQVNPIAPYISYAGASGNGSINVLMTVNPIILRENGGAITDCTITPALTNNLSIDPLTCVISGEPETAMPATNYSVIAHNAGGQSPAAIVTLSVAQVVPVVSYAAGNTSIILNQPVTINPTSLTGTPLTQCTINPDLPNGLAINTADCVISGVPIVAAPTTTYFVTARNSAGPSNGAAVTLTVEAIQPEISFVGSAGTTGAIDSEMIVTPTILKANGAAITCSIAPALSNGLVLDTNTCQITGTPTATLSATYTVTATNAKGSHAATVTLTVGPAKPILSYTDATGRNGNVETLMTVTPTTLKLRGSALTSCTMTPTPPAWMSIDNTTCVISGTPTAKLNEVTYTITATNSVGSTTANVNLSVNAAPPVINYGSPTHTLDLGQTLTITPTELKDYGSLITECNVSPALPAGLSISVPGCVISGSPTTPKASTAYSVTAKNSAGTSVGATINLTVLANPPVISYAGALNNNGNVGYYMIVSPTTLIDNGSAIFSCTISPALPTGLSINNTNCSISGIPQDNLPPSIFTVTAENARAPSTAVVTLSVGNQPPGLSYEGAIGKIGKFNTTMNIAPSSLSANGAPIINCVTTPALPAGLTININTCVISGTPTSTMGPTNYTVTATNSFGDSNPADITLEVKAGAPLISYAAGSQGSVGLPMSITPTLNPNGSPITSCTINPALPAGLSINNTTCVISGTPTVNSTTTSYIVSAQNIIATTTASVDITIGQAVPEVSYVGAFGTAGVRGVPMNVAPIILKANGSPITECTVTPALINGLAINNNTCVISGTPTVVSIATIYTVVAKNNSGDSNPAQVTISVDASAPTISYSGSAGTNGEKNAFMWVAPLMNDHGSAITQCTINPALPTGLIINNTTCEISGTPVSNLSPTLYTVTATNSVGNGTATVTLSVGVGVPTLSYAGANGIVAVDEELFVMPTMIESNGSPITSCTSSPTLPDGLTINNTTCVIFGIPTTTLTPTVFTITAKNTSGFSVGAPVTLEVTAGKPILSYFGSRAFPGYKNSYLTGRPAEFSDNGSPLTSCVVTDGVLPAWATINQTNCEINGTPPEAMPLIELEITATNGIGSTSAQLDLEVLVCPEGFEEIPAYDDTEVTNERFCVMKYEAKNVEGKVASVPNEEPWTNISIGDAQAACKALGLPDQNLFDIISNQEWMSIARQTEGDDQNWMFNDDDPPLKVRMYSGLTNVPGDTPKLVTTPGNPYSDTGKTAADEINAGREKRRTLKIGLTEIWDLAGNVREWVKWDKNLAVNQVPPLCASLDVGSEIFGLLDEDEKVIATCDGWEKKDFLMSELTLTNALHGIGLFKVGVGDLQITRGGDAVENGGIYSVGREANIEATDNLIGFRCVYRPNTP